MKLQSVSLGRWARRALVGMVLGVPSVASAQIVEIADITGDGLGNPLDGPVALAVGGAGEVYVVGGLSLNVLEITPAGVVTEVIAVGDGSSDLVFPQDVAVDAAGNVYVFDMGEFPDFASSAFRVAPDGTVTLLIDGTGDGMGHPLLFGGRVAADASGNAYVSGAFSANAFRITPSGTITQIIDATGDGAGNTLDGAFGLAVDGAGNVFVTGFLSNNVFRIEPTGAITQIIDAAGDGSGNTLAGPRHVALDPSGNVYVAGAASVFRITPAGVITTVLDASGDGAGHPLTTIQGMDVDASGNVFVSDSTGSFVLRAAPTGGVTVVIGPVGDGEGHVLTSAFDVGVDGSGNAYVAGHNSDNVFRIDGAGCATPPLALFRNAGTNPGSFASSIALIGGTLDFTVDLTTTGHDMAMVVGFEDPAEVALGGGQVLLCLLAGDGDLLGTGMQPGPLAHFAFPVPNDVDLIGFSMSAQALHAFGVLPFALSNARDIVIGGGCP